MTDEAQAVDPRYDPRFQRGFEGKTERALVAEPEAQSPEPDPDPVDQDDDAEIADESAEVPTASRNIPELLLLVVGIAAIVGGLLVYSTWGSLIWGTYVGEPDVIDETFRYLVMALPMPLIVAGIASVLAWLTLRALSARPTAGARHE
jgi:hypothetical protein